MTEEQAVPLVERWLPMLADRLWLRQFRVTAIYHDDAKDVEGAPERAQGQCVVDHAYGKVTTHLYLRFIDSEHELFDVLLHETCHAVAFEFFHVEEDLAPAALEERDRELALVHKGFTYAHERFVQRMMNIIHQAYPYPDTWQETQ